MPFLKTERVAPKRKRPKKACPVEGCGARVVHLTRHLRGTHKWTDEKARNAIQSFGLRKGLSVKDNRKHETCPMHGCGRSVKRLAQHLRLLVHGPQEKTRILQRNWGLSIRPI